jgi:hypothetical protein
MDTSIEIAWKEAEAFSGCCPLAYRSPQPGRSSHTVVSWR